MRKERTIMKVKSMVILSAYVAAFGPLLTGEGAVSAQDTGHNYVMTTVRTGSSTSRSSVVYYDSLGHEELSVLVGASPGGSSLVTRIEYDNYGRKNRIWLPCPMPIGAGCAAPSQTSASAVSSHAGDSAPYVSVEYEHSPLSRDVSTTGPGHSWHSGDHQTKKEYFINSGAEWPLTCRKYSLTYSYAFSQETSRTEAQATVTSSGLWPTGSLTVLKTVDEDGHTCYDFTDRNGEVVLTRKMSGGEACDTYYLRDAWGKLLAVLPPGASQDMDHAGSWSSAGGVLASLAYLYHYDTRHRLTAKKLPGCSWIHYVYDRSDELVLTQDGVMAEKGKWTYRLSDAWGRTCVTGTCSASYTLQGAGIPGTVSVSLSQSGYAHSGVVLDSMEMVAETFYDNYGGIPFDTGTPSSFGLAQVVPTAAKGKVTASRSRVLNMSNNPKYLTTIHWYDWKGREAQSLSGNILSGSDRWACSYDWMGNITSERKIHTADGEITLDETIDRTYDTWDRPLSVTHSVNGSTPVILASYTYDALGRVATKTIGGLETTSYTYNVRSWPKKISGQRFTERLCYNTSVDGLNPILPHQYCWSGRVGAYAWQSGGETRQRGYGLVYDDQGRLTSANYGEGIFLGNYMGLYDEKAEYDDMGNPTWVYRKSPNSLNGSRTSSPSDRLRLEYDGNQLVHVTDSVTSGHTYTGAFHFADGADETEEYEYDKNGNMVKDLNRGVTGIQYNLLNLPLRMDFADGYTTHYAYSATGEKLSTTVTLAMMPILSSSMGGTSSEGVQVASGEERSFAPTLDRSFYCGHVVYVNGDCRLLTDEGYVTFSSDGTPQYHYYLRDHLGNIRVVFDQTGAVEQVNHYYAFGSLMRESSNPGVQPYKYGGKELDRTGGLDAYDFGARSYFADRLQWSTMDPHCEKYYDVTPYGYCLNSPINMVDLFGEKPGDFFKTMDDAAIDFGNYYNGTSIKHNLEFGSTIYLTTDENGKVGYTYTVAKVGSTNDVTPSKAPKGAYAVADIHTHGDSLKDNEGREFYNNSFSGASRESDELKAANENKKKTGINDIASANRSGMPYSYLVSPNGSLQKYNVYTGKITIVSEEMPSSYADDDRRNLNDAVANWQIYKDNLPFSIHHLSPQAGAIYWRTVLEAIQGK